MTTTNTAIRSQSATIPQVRLSERVWRRALPYLLVFPTFLFVVMFTLWPTVSAVINSTIKPPPTVKQQAKFVGLQNYIDLFNPDTPIGDDFPRVFTNTLIFVGLTVPICMALAFGLAMLLNRKIKALGLYRFAFFYPVLMPLIGAGSIFAFIFADTIGLANTVLRSFGLAGIKWVGDANWTFISIMLVTIWKQTGFFMIMYLAGLQNLPQDVYEAADLDGATIWQKIRYLTFPLLRGTTLFILTTGAAGAFQQVDQLYALGEGAPNQRSNLILYFLFQKYNEPRNLGYVNAITVILLILLLSFTVINFVLWERQTYYEN